MILLLSKDLDQSTDDVIDWLNYFQCPFIRLNGDDYLNFKFSYSYEISKNDALCIEGVNLNEIKSVWYRRWISFNFIFKNALEKINNVDPVSLADIKNNIVTEMRKSYQPIFDFLKKKTTKSIPSIDSLTINKLNILIEAKNKGIKIPESIICNNKIDLIKFKEKHAKIITKPLGEVITFEGKDTLYFTRTIIIDEEKLGKIEEYFFPSFFQEYIEKEIEIRSFYLEGKFYSMAIFSQLDEKTRVDFRNYNDIHPNRKVPMNLPQTLESKLDELMQGLKLNTGSLDLILTPQGEFYFLEVNPVGQFGMTSYPCNYYLEKKVAESLIS